MSKGSPLAKFGQHLSSAASCRQCQLATKFYGDGLEMDWKRPITLYLGDGLRLPTIRIRKEDEHLEV